MKKFFMLFVLLFFTGCSDPGEIISDPDTREQVLAIEINYAIQSCINNGGVSMMYVQHTPINMEPMYYRYSFVRCYDGAIFKWKLINPDTNVYGDETIEFHG
jgi:hypothetical protein